MPIGRVPFTPADRQLLAVHLYKEPKDNRLRPSLYKPFAEKHPHHTWESWMEHYKKSGREDTDRRIAKIKREKKEEREAAKAAAQGAAPSSARSKDKGKKRAREPSTEDEEEGEEEEGESASDDVMSIRNTRTPFDEKDHRSLVKYLARAEDKDESKQSAYAALADAIPEHGPTSWQTYYSQHKNAIDEEVYERRKRIKRERKEAEFQARRTSVAMLTPEAKAKGPRLSSSTATEQSRRGSIAASNGKSKTTTLRSSISPQVPGRKIKKAKLDDQRQPEAGPSSSRKSVNTPTSSVKGKAVETAGDEESEEEMRTPNPVFTEEDESLIVFCLARVECRDEPREKAWEYLDFRHDHHTGEEWKGYYIANKATLFPRVANKVAEIYRDQARKRERAEQLAMAKGEAATEEAKEGRGKGKGTAKEEVAGGEEDENEIVVVQKGVIDVTVTQGEDKSAPAAPNEVPAAPFVSLTAHKPSPPTPKPTPPSSSHSQARKSQPIEVAITTSEVNVVEVQQQQQPAAAAAAATVPVSSNSTDPDPSTQNSSLDSKVSPIHAHNITANVDGQAAAEDNDLSTLAAAEMQRKRSLPSPFIKADQYPPEPVPSVATADAHAQARVNGSDNVEDQDREDDSHSLADSDDQRMDEHLRSEVKAQTDPIGEVLEGIALEWLPLTVAQQALVNSIFEVDEQLQLEEEMDRVAVMEEEEKRRIAVEKLAAEEERQTVAREKATAEESRKAREKEEARLKALEEKKMKEVKGVAEEKARAEEAEQRRLDGETKKQQEQEELARRQAAQAAQLQKRQEAVEAAAVVAEVEARRMAAVKAGKKRAVEPEASTVILEKPTRGSSAIRSPHPFTTPSRAAMATTATASTSRKRARDSTDGSVGIEDYPPPSGKKPRASLAASARKPSVSASPAPAPSTASATTLTLKEELALRRDIYSLPKRGPHALYLSVSCPTDFKILDKVCQWFSPTLRPAKGTAEYAELEKWVAKEVWSYDDDVIVLAGTGEAKEAIERKKGRKAVNARRAVLCSAGIEMVSQLKKGWPWAPR